MSIKAQLIVAVALFAGAACEDVNRPAETTEFGINDTRFSVPSRVVRSVRDGESGFIRINDPHTPIEIVYDAKLQGNTDRRGYALLFSVNDGDYPRVDYYRTTSGMPVICRNSANAATRTCGSAVEFEGSTWTVLLPPKRIGDADAFRRRAENLLRDFSR